MIASILIDKRTQQMDIAPAEIRTRISLHPIKYKCYAQLSGPGDKTKKTACRLFFCYSHPSNQQRRPLLMPF